MKLMKFRIRNYKSIKDSNYCYLDEKVTILAGKNEAGKTVILEALEDFNIDRNIREEAKPMWDQSRLPEISISVKLNTKEIIKMKKEFQVETSENKIVIDIIKKFPDKYSLSDETLDRIISNSESAENIKKKISEIIALINKNDENSPLSLDLLEDPQQLYSILQTYNAEFNSDFAENQKMIKEKITELKKSAKILNDILDFVKKNYTPNFILFTTFENVLPSQISISEAPDDPLIKDLSRISNLDFDIVSPETHARKREMHKEEVNLRFSEDYKQFWTQDHSNLYIHWDSENIYFWIKEGRELYPPEVRSKGKQWHLAYYIRVTARSLEDKRNILLIDEPGLFLHAKAQKDILQKLEECSERSQIVYSTHSPYSIPSDKLGRVRLVIRPDEDFTRIEKVTANADKETLTPILTAIGEDLSTGIRVDKKNSVVVEGFSDYIYLNAFKKLLDIKEELNFVPATGGDTPVYVGSILLGWGLNPIFVLDNDRQGKKVSKRLRKRLSIDKKRIILSPENSEGSIENLFSDKDFKKFLNSEESKKSKVLLSREFSQKVEKEEIKLNDLSKKTINSFKGLFDRLSELTTESQSKPKDGES
jgi:predicted ATP-dependent endonuclease of OLD family